MNSGFDVATGHCISTFYKFKKLSDPPEVQKLLENKAAELNIKGLIILATEGLNATISAGPGAELPAPARLQKFKAFINELLQEDLFYKDSVSDKAPFRRFKVKIRSEIVTLGAEDLYPSSEKNHHLSPTEWNKVLKEEKDFLLIDTRNWYETQIGTFKGAINPHTDTFTEFPEFMQKNQFAKDKKVLIFCTGGIRCEKGILELQRQGYDNVYQLEGGILNYIQQHPHDQFEGECFVFDHRVALDQDLKPTTKYGLCPHCGQPSTVAVECKRCDHHGMICHDCAELAWKKDTCSKNCAYQYELHPERKAARQLVPFEAET